MSALHGKIHVVELDYACSCVGDVAYEYIVCLLNYTVYFVVAQVQLVQEVVDGVNLLVEMEKKLEKGESIDSLMPK